MLLIPSAPFVPSAFSAFSRARTTARSPGAPKRSKPSAALLIHRKPLTMAGIKFVSTGSPLLRSGQASPSRRGDCPGSGALSASKPRIKKPQLRHSSIISGLRWIHSKADRESLSNLRSRGGHGFPAFTAARLASRIATICFACARVSSRRLATPPRRPIFARYWRTRFSASVIVFQNGRRSACPTVHCDNYAS